MFFWDEGGVLELLKMADFGQIQRFLGPSSGDGNFEEPKITKMQKKRRLGPSFKKLPQVTVFDVF